MDVLPGLRIHTAPSEPANPSPREPREGGARFEQHLEAARRPSERDSGLPRAEDSAGRARPEREPAAEPAVRPAVRPAAKPADPARAEPETDAPDAAAESTPDAQKPNPAPKVDRARPKTEGALIPSLELAVTAAPAALAAEPSAKPAAGAQGSDPKPACEASAAAVMPAPAAPQPAVSAAAPAPEPLPVAGTLATSGDGNASSAIELAGAPDSAPDAPALPAQASANAPAPAVDFERELSRVRELALQRAPADLRPTSGGEAAAEILRQVRVGLSSDLREANIQLAPEALGRVSIRLRVEDGALSADVRAESAQALRALELHAPELKALLAQNGVTPRSLSFGFLDPHGSAAGRDAHARRSPSRARSIDLSPIAPLALERALARRMSAAGVDTYA